MGIAGALSVRVVYLGVTERDFLQEEGDKRSIYEKRLLACAAWLAVMARP